MGALGQAGGTSGNCTMGNMSGSSMGKVGSSVDSVPVTMTTTLLGCFGVSAPPQPISSQLPVGSGGTFTAFKLPFVHAFFCDKYNILILHFVFHFLKQPLNNLKALSNQNLQQIVSLTNPQKKYFATCSYPSFFLRARKPF